MQKNIKYLFCLLLLSAAVASKAQQQTLADFNAVAGRFKSLSTYSYQTESVASFPNGHKETMTASTYMDGPNKRVCYKNNFQMVIVTPKYALKVDHQQKTVGIYDVVQYQKKNKLASKELTALFNTSDVSSFLDSVVLKKATLESAKKSGVLTTYVLGFPKGFYIRKVTLVYNAQKDLPQSLKIVSFYADQQQGGQSMGTTYEATCKDYSLAVPSQVFDLQQYFTVKGGKVVLQQFKNYKLSAIL